jgi:hypothetical protein
MSFYNNYIYAGLGNYTNFKISIIDGFLGNIIKTLTVDNGLNHTPTSIAADDDYVYLVDGYAKLYRVNNNTGEVNYITLNNNAYRLKADYTNNYLYLFYGTPTATKPAVSRILINDSSKFNMTYMEEFCKIAPVYTGYSSAFNNFVLTNNNIIIRLSIYELVILDKAGVLIKKITYSSNNDAGGNGYFMGGIYADDISSNHINIVGLRNSHNTLSSNWINLYDWSSETIWSENKALTEEIWEDGIPSTPKAIVTPSGFPSLFYFCIYNTANQQSVDKQLYTFNNTSLNYIETNILPYTPSNCIYNPLTGYIFSSNYDYISDTSYYNILVQLDSYRNVLREITLSDNVAIGCVCIGADFLDQDTPVFIPNSSYTGFKYSKNKQYPIGDEPDCKVNYLVIGKIDE